MIVPLDEPEFLVDACGEALNVPEISCQVGSRRFKYVFSPELKQGSSFAFGAFFSKAVLSDDVFRYPRRQRIAVLTESPIDSCYQHIPELVSRFPLIFTHQQHLLAMGGPFRPLAFGTNWLGIGDAASTERLRGEHPSKTELVSFIGSLEHSDVGAYRFRREVAEFAISRDDVSCFGRGIRPIDSKRDALEPFRFSIAMENAASNDYFSEKLIDCFLLETVPIYFGWPAIAEHFDSRGFFTFGSIEELAAILDGLSASTYEQMRPYVQENKGRAIALRWHNHQGLLQRLSEQIPDGVLDGRSRPFRLHGRPERAVRRFLGRLAL